MKGYDKLINIPESSPKLVKQNTGRYAADSSSEISEEFACSINDYGRMTGFETQNN